MKHASQATVLLRRWWLQIVAVLLGISAGLLFSALKEPVYTAEAYVVVVADDKSNIEQATNFAQAFARIVTQPGIIGAAVRPGLPAQTVDQLQQVVRVSASPDAPLIRLGASSAQPAHAAIQANAVAQALISYANLHAADTGVRIANLSTAASPGEPSSPNLGLNLAVGTAAGCLLGALFFLIAPARQRRAAFDAGPAREHLVKRQRVKA
ncbi:Wzz/FepE/Etk N-terminal domain-containing protein [Nonomuraea sp. NBC_01738]|uniref:YveK family protein n=1 Tax=Nonomuraea sp. NBC_01738 TaxID=2976003 RepID=UPI002E101024|nr:Wzz/FepE/Etk N-terminal domain-containing protein [Nonomuraea sp. NBC_01738]